ncbi:MAG: hypothetical protein D6707_08650 [Bacteroidetes bacterium]|nr:MAG: hypothetical protein D6707_08650 [Bacteroidota bacterium]
MSGIRPAFFQKPYQREKFLTFLAIFLPEDFSIRKEDFYKPDKYKTITDAYRIGQVPSLDVSVIEITHNTKDARIAIAMDAFKLMAENGIWRALIIFKNESDNYRFSYLTIELNEDENGKLKNTYSNPRRHSFFLGADAKINTPYQQLVKAGKIKDIDDLKRRFSLEVVNKEFYKQLVGLFNELVKGETGVLQLPEKRGDDVRKHFGVRLIGRIIFTWFLKQKSSHKGQLVPDEILSSKAVIAEKYTGGYYHDRLERLFFELLNTPLERRNLRSDLFDLVPYLNGGLFSPHQDDFYKLNQTTGYSEYLNTLKISDDWFVRFFEFLETYNFTIDENTAFDQDLSIDPEMLGRIFENLLAEIDEDTGKSARKITGSFYTPRQVVDYMVDESLVVYFREKTHLSEEKIKAIISYDRNDDKDHPLDSKDKQELIDAIEELRVFDPAAGSGAFLIGMLQKLVYILHIIDEDGVLWRDKKLAKIPEVYRKKFEEELNSQSKDYIRKLEVIKNSIFGVDIQPIAVEVARLRAFLTLVVEEGIDEDKTNRGIEPLPNLEFKFVCANTLIPAPEQGNTDSQLVFSDDFKEKLMIQIDKYFSATGSEKIIYLNEIRNLIDGKVENKLQQLQSLVSYNGDEKFERALAQKNKKTIFAQSRVMMLWDSYKNLFENKPVGFFDIEYFFPSAKDGFDIVIGNPPYVSLEKIKENKDIYKECYSVFAPRGDLYALFYERGLQLTRDNGYLIYITSNKWMRAGYGEKLREYFAKKNPLKLIDFGGFKVFESATVDTNILLIQNASNQNHLETCHFKNDYKRGQSIAEYFEQNKIVLKNLNSDTWFIGSQAEIALKEKIERIGTPLKDWDVKINYGIKTGFNEVFIIDGAVKAKLIAEDPKSEEIIKPLLRGRDIKRYGYDFADRWLIVVKFGAHKYLQEKYPAIYNHLKQYEEKLKNRGQCKYTRTQKKKEDAGYPGQHHWLELDNNPTDDYLQEFEKEKVVWQRITQSPRFCAVEPGMYILDSMAFFSGGNAKYITAILNSKLIAKYIDFIVHQYGDTGFRLSNQYVAMMPIPKIISKNEHIAKQIESLVDQILQAKKQNPNADTKDLENQIDELVFELYGLREEKELILSN